MSRATAFASPRRATNVTLSETLLQDAREMGINLSQACERGLAVEVANTYRQRWLEENKGAMDAWNGHVAEPTAFTQFTCGGDQALIPWSIFGSGECVGYSRRRAW